MSGAAAPPIVQEPPARGATAVAAALLQSTMTLPARPLRFVRGNQTVTVDAAPPDAMLLDWLREQGQHGTREGCAEGDCGACTVVLGELHDGQLRLRAVNSCIRLLSSVDGCAVFTIEDLARADGTLHPAQQAMLECHGSQCGFCTPGFVMSLFALYHEAGSAAAPGCIGRACAQQAVSGNLCRCTGYRPILQAAQTMHTHAPHAIDTEGLAGRLQALHSASGQRIEHDRGTTWRPASLAQALQCRADQPQAQVVAGTTDVGLWINKLHQQPSQVIDLSAAPDMARIETRDGALRIGAAARLTDAFAALARHYPDLADFMTRFAGQTVRNAATLGGNIANGSPIGDSMPMLIALGSTLTLASVRGTRELPLEAFFTGYRRTLLEADELISDVAIPLPRPDQVVRAYKLSKRFEDDISAVCLVVSMRRAAGRADGVRLGVGGMAATPMRATQTEAAMLGQPWTLATMQRAAAVLRQEFAPISDMRATADYRREVIGNLLIRLWHELETNEPTLRELAR